MEAKETRTETVQRCAALKEAIHSKETKPKKDTASEGNAGQAIS